MINFTEIAMAHTSEPELPVVICVPAWSSEKTVAVVKKAAKKASFTVLTTLSQPAAAVLAYGLADDNKQNGFVLLQTAVKTDLQIEKL